MAIRQTQSTRGAIILVFLLLIIAWVTGISDPNGISWCYSNEHAFSMDFSMIATAGFIGTAFAFYLLTFLIRQAHLQVLQINAS